MACALHFAAGLIFAGLILGNLRPILAALVCVAS